MGLLCALVTMHLKTVVTIEPENCLCGRDVFQFIGTKLKEARSLY